MGPHDVTECKAIGKLSGVRRASFSSPNPADAAYELLRRAVMRLDARTRRQINILLGWTQESEALTLTARYKRLGQYLNISADTWRTERESRVLLELAREVDSLDRESEYLERSVRMVTSPFDSRLHI